MKLSLARQDLKQYVSCQIDTFFPDGQKAKIPTITFDLALQRLEHCLSHIKFYSNDDRVLFDHLHSDQYLTFLWILSNQNWLDTGDSRLSTKIYYLNKALHSFDCFYDNGLPSIFYIAHGVGITLGKASYSDFLYVCKGATVGASRGGAYPVIQERVSLGANSTIIGNLTLQKSSSVGAGVTLFNKGVSRNSAIIQSRNGGLEEVPQSRALSSYVFYETKKYKSDIN